MGANHLAALRLGVLLATLAAAGCGGGSPASTTAAPAVTGAVTKGPVRSADVVLYEFDNAGAPIGAALATATTGADGQFTVPAFTAPAGAAFVLAKACGRADGTTFFVDESDPEPNAALKRRIALGTGDCLEGVHAINTPSVAITPYSMALLKKARTQAAGSNFANVLLGVQAQAAAAFGFDPFTTVPADPATGAGGDTGYAILLGAAAQAINAIAVSAGHIPAFADVLAFVNDFADGQLDQASLPAEIRRFRNNNFGVYGGVPEPAVDEAALSLPADVPNSAPTGTPVITGTAAEDQALGVDVSGIADVDGLGAFSYQWRRNGTAIGGATASTYTPGDGDVGFMIGVTVSYVDGGGSAEAVTSAAVGPVTGVNDAPVGSPAIVGTATQGQTLSADTTGISDADGLGTFSYEWQRGTTAIAGATASTYTLVEADVGSTIRVVVRYTDGQGTLESLASAATAAVANVNDPPVIVTGFAGGSIGEDTSTGGLDYTVSDAETAVAALGFAAVSDNPTLVPATSFSYADDGDGIGNKTLTITPAPNEYGSATITVTVTDADGATDTESWVLTVDPVSDAPESQSFGIQTDQDVPYVFGTTEFNVIDPVDAAGDGSDADTFAALVIGSLPASGTLVLNDGVSDQPITALPFPPIATSEITLGRFKFVPGPGESGVPYASFTFQVQDSGITANGGQVTSIAYVLNVDVLPVAAESLLPYLTGSTLADVPPPAGDLLLLDPLNPGSPLTLAVGVPHVNFDARTLLRADVVAGVAANLRPARIVYIQVSGTSRTLWLANLEPGQPHAPVQVSNIADACKINGVAEDFANPDNSLVRIDTAGGDGVCGSTDDFTAPAFLVPLTTASTAPGIPLGQGHCCGLVGLADGSGAITGVLATEDDGTGTTFQLTRRNVGSLGSPIQLATLEIAGNGPVYQSLVRGLGDQGVYLRARRSTDTTYRLLRFNTADNTLTELFDFGISDAAGFLAHLDSGTYDASNLYFAGGDGTGIYAVPHAATGPGAAVTLVAPPGPGAALELEQTTDRIVFETDGPGGGVYSVPKAGGALATLATDSVEPPSQVLLETTAADRVYVSVQAPTLVPAQYAKIFAGDGTLLQTIDDAAWAGQSFDRSCDFAADCEDTIAALALYLRHTAGGNDGEIEVVDPATGPTGKRIGYLANIYPGISVFGFGFGRYVQFTTFSLAGNTDVVLGDLQAATVLPEPPPTMVIVSDGGGDDRWLTFGSEDNVQGSADSDGDGLSNEQEAGLGTDPNRFDTDGDGLGDGEEVNTTLTDPLNPDTDSDGLKDGEEVSLYGTDPTLGDTDADGAGDGLEIRVGSSANDQINPNPVIYANAACGAACDGSSFATGWPTQAEVLAAITAAGGGGISGADTLYVLYAPGVYAPLALTDTPRGFIALAGSLGDGVYQASYPPTTTFDAANSGPALRLANVQPINIEGIAFTGGNNPQGGGVMLDVAGAGVGLQMYMRRVRIHGNQAEQGGGLALLAEPGSFNDSVEIEDSVIENNVASSSSLPAAGGGLYMAEGAMTLRRVKVVSNQASGTGAAAHGGGLFVGGTLGIRLEDSDVSGNKVFSDAALPGSGGGIHLDGTTFLDFYMEFSRVTGNQTNGAVGVTSGGGGLYAGGDTRALIEASVFASNSAFNGPGGAVNALDTPDVGIEHSQFLSNTAKRPGGALHVHVPAGGLADVFNSLFVGNTAQDADADGGAIEVENLLGGSLKLESNTVAYNQLTGNGGALGGGVSVNSLSPSDTFRNNIVWFNDNATVNDPVTQAQAGDNLFFDAAITASGNNVKEPGFAGNSVADNPLFALGFYLDALSSSLDAGDDTAGAVFFSTFAGPFTTSGDGTPDAGTVDIGFHHPLGKAADPAAITADAFAMPVTAGCPAATVHVSLAAGNVNLGPGHLVVADNLAGQGALSGQTTLDPQGTGTSVLGMDEGDGKYRFDLSGSSSGSYTVDIYVDGAGPFATGFSCF